jgi:hypothetical protein
VAVLAGRELETAFPGPAVSADAPAGMAWYSTDVLTDLYRGGFCAGLLAAGRAGDIVVFQANALDPEQRSALLKGAEGSAGTETASRVSFVSGNFSGETACAVIIDGGEAFFRENADTPFILYTWLDPAAVPAEAAVIFSDSPWETLPEALKLLTKGRFEGIVPSVPHVSGSAAISAGQIKRLNFSREIADN